MGSRNGALGAAALIVAAITGESALAQAPQRATANPGAGDHAVIRFSIPEQPLAPALASFGNAADLQVLYTADVARNMRTNGVQGAFSKGEALRQLLAGTGLVYRFTNASTVTIERTGSPRTAAASVPGAIPLDTIDVQGAGSSTSTMRPLPAYAGGQVAIGGQVGLLGNRSFMDTPFNQTSYTQKTIQEQQAQTLSDVLDNDPSVRPSAPRGYGFESFFIRGFGVGGGSTGINGLYGLSSLFSFTGLDSVERVEVLKGPGTLLNGMPPFGDIGGSINLVTKRAGDTPLAQLTAMYASDSQFGTHVDVGQRYGDNKEFGIRFNGTFRGGDTAVDGQSEQLGGASLSLDYRGERVRLSADLGYQNDQWDGLARPAFLGGGLTRLPEAPNASTNFNPPWGYSRTKASLAMVQGEFDITDNTTAYASAGITDNYMKFRFVNPTITDAQGSFSSPVAILADERWRNMAAQAGIRSVIETGPVEHAVNVNVSALNDKYWWSPNVAGISLSSNIYNPVFPDAPNIASDPRLPDTLNKLWSAGVSDTMSILNKRIQLTIGVRRQSVESDSLDATGAVANGYDASAWSPAYALVVKPVENISLYANYIEGLQQGTIVGNSYANAGTIFPPYQSKQYETGIKVDWGRFTTTASLFQISQPNAITIPGTPLPTLAVNGENRNRGLELNVFGQVNDQVRILGGVMLDDARQLKTQGGTNDGKKTAGISDVQLNIGAEWDTPFLPGFTVSGRVIHTGRSYADNANTLVLPSWTRVDLGARYTFLSSWNKKPIVVNFSVQNAFGANYWMSGGDNTVFLGSPRTYLVSTTFNF